MVAVLAFRSINFHLAAPSMFTSRRQALFIPYRPQDLKPHEPHGVAEPAPYVFGVVKPDM